MKIIVCVKQVPDVKVPLTIAPGAEAIEEEGLVYVLNPADHCAVEEAVRLKERFTESEVTVITMGPPRAERVLRTCLAMGADRALHLWDEAFAGADAYATAVVLAAGISQLEYDLILCGVRSSDGGSGQVGASLAELLALPMVSAITKLEISPHGRLAVVHRKVERGNREVVECPLPALFTTEVGLNEPRYPSLPALMEALTQEVAVLDRISLGLPPERVGLRGSPTRVVRLAPPRPRPKKIPAPDSRLPPAERIKALLSVGVMERKGRELLEGSPAELADRVVQFLQKEKLIPA